MAFTQLWFSGCGDQGGSAQLPFDWLGGASAANNYGFNVNVVQGQTGNGFQIIYNSTVGGGLGFWPPGLSVASGAAFSMGMFIFVATNAPYNQQCIAQINSGASTQPVQLFIAAASNPPVVLSVSSNGGSSYDISGNISYNQWHHVELFFSAGLTGVNSNPVAMYIDGTLAASGTLAHSANQSPPMTQFQIGTTAAASGGEIVNYDNFFVAVGASGLPLGPQIVNTTLPAGTGQFSSWAQFPVSTTSAGNYTFVNVIPPNGDTAYLYTASPGAKDAYLLAPLVISPSTITAVKSVSSIYQTGTTRTYAIGIGNGVTQSFGGTLTPGGTTSASYAYTSSVFITNPFTSAAWAVGDLNTLQVVQECVS